MTLKSKAAYVKAASSFIHSAPTGESGTGGVDLTFATRLASILTFAKGAAAKGCEYQNQTTSVRIVRARPASINVLD